MLKSWTIQASEEKKKKEREKKGRQLKTLKKECSPQPKSLCWHEIIVEKKVFFGIEEALCHMFGSHRTFTSRPPVDNSPNEEAVCGNGRVASRRHTFVTERHFRQDFHYAAKCSRRKKEKGNARVSSSVFRVPSHALPLLFLLSTELGDFIFVSCLY